MPNRTPDELLSKSAALPEPGEHSGVVAIRRALTGVDDLLSTGDDRPMSLADARRAVTFGWGAYWAGRYEQLGDMLPDALTAIRRGACSGETAELAAQLYQIAGCTLVHLGHPDAAHMALREALRLAETGQDALRPAALRGSLSWLLLTQGRFSEAYRVAVATAESVSPGRDTELPRMSLWGSLVLSGATAAGRDGRAEEAEHLLGEAADVARHTGHRSDYECAFGPDQVTMQTVDVQVVTERYGPALKTARHMPRSTPLPLAAKARHLSDRALCHARLGQDAPALDVLLAMEGTAPKWSRYQAQPRGIVRELLEREKRVRTPRLRELAHRMSVTA